MVIYKSYIDIYQARRIRVGNIMLRLSCKWRERASLKIIIEICGFLPGVEY